MYDDMEDDKEIAISKGESSLERLALKACPFCGGKADYLRIMSDLYWSVQCGKCGGGSGGSVNKTITRDKWNERAALALPSQRPDDEGVDEAKLLHLISSELLIVDFDDARKQADNLLAAKQDAKRIYEKIRPYLRAKPDAELVEKLHSAIKDASSEFERGENNGLRHAVEIARQHTCAGAGKGVVDEEALAKAAYDAVLRIRESEDAPGFDICLKAEMDNRRPIIETYVAALAQWKVSV